MFLAWSQDLATTARKFLKFLCLMTKQKVKEFSEADFWNRNHIWGFYHFLNSKKYAANTKHNNLNALCGILNILAQAPTLEEKMVEIKQNY